MSRGLLSHRLVFCLALSAFGAGVSGRAVGMMKEDEDELIFSSVKVLVQRFVDKTEAIPLKPDSKDQVTLQGRFISPYTLTQDQARQILGLDDYGQPLPNAKDLPLHRDFKVQVETDEEPFPISQSISHYLFHKLLTGEEGVLPTTILTLKDVQILTPSLSGKGKSQYNFTPVPYTYAIMLQPRLHTTLKEKLSSGIFQGEEFLPSQKGALLLSSFLTHPSEVLAEDISILRDEHNVSTLYYKPNTLSPSPICFSRASLKHFLDVKNVLYLLPEVMEQIIDPSLKQRLLKLNPSLFVLQWLDYLQKEQKEYDNLLVRSGLSLNHRIDLGLPLTLPPRLSEGFLKALSFLQEGLKTATSYQGLLETLFPLVAYSYQTLKDLSLLAHWNALTLIETQYDSMKGRTTPAKSLEEILNLSGTLVNGKDVFEALEEEKFPFAGNVLIQSLSEAAHKVIERIRFKDLSLKDQVFLLSLLGKSFKEPTLKVAQKHKDLKDSQLADPYTLSSLLYPAKDKASIELLLNLGADSKVQNADKETPLHTRIKLLDPKDQKAAWPLLRALGKGGVDLNAEDNTGATVFDVALERGLDLIFTRLINLSARQWKPFTPLKVNPELLVKRYRQWVQEGRTNKRLKKAFDLLSQMSSQSAWHLALEEILPAPQPIELTYERLASIVQSHIQDKDDREDIEGLIQKQRPFAKIKEQIEMVLKKSLTALQNTGKKIQGVFMGERCLLPEIEEQLFEVDGKVKKHNIEYGRRDVAKVDLQGKILYFKHLPELPGFEYAIHLLHHKLIGQGTPPSELIKIGKEAFLVSLGIEGDNLQDVLKNTPDLLQQLEPQSLSALILMTMLTNPEDSKPDNYILNPLPFKPNQYSLISVDNDHALIPTLARVSDDPQARTFLQVKSLLYCLDQMKESISEEVREFFYKINPYEIFKEWLEDLKDLDARYESLFPNAEAAALTSQGCIVRIPFKPQMIAQLYDKMVRLQKIFAPKKNSTSLQPLTHEEVLLKLEPLLGKRYGIGFTKPLSVAERFDLINERFYNKASMHYVSMTSSSILLQSLEIPAEESLIQAISLVKHLTIGGALEELEAIRVEKDKELLGGNKVEGFLKSLKTENARASFLSRFDFKNLDQAQQQALLRILENSDPRSLTFRNCGALTEEALVEKIGVGNLTKLVIINNAELENKPNLNDDFIKVLEEKNGVLRGLFLGQLPGLAHVKLNFPKLTTLVIKNCENLATIEIEGPHLQKLVASGCPLLGEVKLNGTNLRYLDLSNNNTLTDETLGALLNTQSYLKILNVKGSQNISFPEVRSTNHKYPVKLLKALNFSKTQDLFYYVFQLLSQNKTLTELDLKNKKIGDKEVKALSEALKVNTTLQCLNLSSNSVGPEGARALSEAIKVNTAVEELNLSDNKIGIEGASAFGEALKVNITLKKLNLKSNKIGNKGESALAKALNMPQWMFQDFNTQWLRRAAEQILEEKLKDNLNLKYNDYVGKEFGEALGQALEGERAIAEALNIPLTQWVSQDFKTQWLEAAEQILKEKLKDDIVFQQLNLRTLSEGIKVNAVLKELDLSDNAIRDEGVANIGAVLKDNKTLKKLDLSSNAIGDKGGKALAEALKVNTTLQWLNLKYNDYVGKEFGEALGEALKINNTLQWLNLGNTFIEDEGAKFLAEALNINTTLQYLNLWNLTYNEETLKALGKALQVNQTLQKLAVWTGLYTDTAKNTVEAFFKALEGNTALKKLKLNGYRACKIMTPLSNFLKINNTLQELILWEFLPENDVEEQNFYDALKVNTTLRRLIIKPVCRQWNFNEVLKVNVSLKELILGHSSNNLFHCNVRPSIIRLLAQDQVLTDLDLRNKQIGDKEVKALSEALKVNMILQYLSLSGNNVGAEGAVALGEMLIKTKTLQYLNLQGNQIGDEGAKTLGKALKVNTTLQYLYLGSNNIGIEGAQILSEALKVNTTLQLLCLMNNRIGAEGATAFGEALKANNVLQQLSLEWALI
ncbi:MAG: hypothetical protein JNJ47_00550, partial [Alphaproteobacteria bacterium]|nr:hypothetical protein [Alphaproteobacteria bacterium]